MSELDGLKAELAEAQRDLAELDALPPSDDEIEWALRDSRRMRRSREIRELNEKIQVAEAKEGIELAGLLGGDPKPTPPPLIPPDTAARAPKGCSPTLFAIAAAVVAIVIGGIVLLTGKDDDETAADCPSGAPAVDADPPIRLISSTQSCPSADDGTDTGDTAAPEGAAGSEDADGSDVSSYAGHYVLTEGLDDPSGKFVILLGGTRQITAHPSTGSFDVDESGTITGGEVHLSITDVSDIGTCEWSYDSDTASGSLSASDAGAAGQVTWEGEITTGEPCVAAGNGFDSLRIFQLGIVGDDVVLCEVAMAADLQSCSVELPTVAGRLSRQ